MPQGRSNGGRRWAAMTAALAGLTIVLLGCASDGETDAAAGAATSSTAPGTVTLPDGPAAMSDEDYAVMALDQATSLGRAGSDACWIDSAMGPNPPTPATSLQVRLSVQVWVDFTSGLQQALPEHALAIGETASVVQGAAFRADFPVGFWTSGEVAEALAAPEWAAAMSAYEAYLAANCGSSPTVTTPG